jgi:hypothetical protein
LYSKDFKCHKKTEHKGWKKASGNHPEAFLFHNNAQKIYMLKKNLWIFHEKKKNLDMHLFFHGK